MSLRRAATLSVVLLATCALIAGTAVARGGRSRGAGSGSSGSSRRATGGGGNQSGTQRRGGGGPGGGSGAGQGQRGGGGYQSGARSRGFGGGGYGSSGLGRGGQQGQGYQHQQRSQNRNQQQTQARHRHQGEGGPHRWGYDRGSEGTVSGQVMEGPARGRGEGIENTVRVRTREGEEARLHLGPGWYREALGLNPQPGDEIAGIGARGQQQNANQIMAREINWNGRTYRLRNEEGIPLWSGADRPEWSGYAGMWDGSRHREITGEVDGIEGMAPGGEDMGRGVVLRLRARERTQTQQRDGAQNQEQARARQRETERVHLGPYWFVEENMPQLRPGQQVTVRGAPGEWRGEQVLIASEMERNQDRMRLRTGEGRPEWASGWQNWDGWGPGAQYGRMYDPARERTIAGRVERVDEEAPMEGMGRGLALRVRTQEQTRVRAHLGPVWFAEQFDLAPRPGDELTLMGSVVEMNGRQVMMVREMEANQRRVRIREQDGTPIWAGRGPGEPQRAEQHVGAPAPPPGPARGAAAD